MFTKYILNPTEEIYLENLLKSNIFKKDTDILKEKYKGKGVDYGMPIDKAVQDYSEEQMILYRGFWVDNKELVKRYYIEKYEKEMPCYYFGAGFMPLVKNHISFDETGIHVHFSGQVTKDEYDAVWQDIGFAKKAYNKIILKGAYNLRDKKGEHTTFDLKLILYKIKYEDYKPSEQEAYQIGEMDKAQQRRGISEIKKYIEALKK